MDADVYRTVLRPPVTGLQDAQAAFLQVQGRGRKLCGFALFRVPLVRLVDLCAGGVTAASGAWGRKWLQLLDWEESGGRARRSEVWALTGKTSVHCAAAAPPVACIPRCCACCRPLFRTLAAVPTKNVAEVGKYVLTVLYSNIGCNVAC
jgi:hypothetical protein